jgi:hypothetical protein
MSFCVLIGTTSAIFVFLKCHQFPLPDGNDQPYESYLYADYSVSVSHISSRVIIQRLLLTMFART